MGMLSDGEKVSEEYRSGERTYPEWMLGNLSIVGNMFGDMLGTVADRLVPDELGIGENVAKAGAYLMNTPVGRGAQELAQEYPRTARNIGETFGASQLILPTRALVNPKEMMQKAVANIPNDLNFGDAKFYLKPAEAETRAKKNSPWLYSKSPEAAIKYEQGMSRFKATSKGFAQGLKNFIIQSTTPEGQALWRQKGVSKTLEDIAKDPNVKPNVAWGQAAYERLLGSQYGNKSPILSQLDNDYFTHEGVFKFADFAKHTGHAPQDAAPFMRTIMANNKIKEGDDYIMIVRQPTATEGSGDLISDMMFKSTTARKLQTLFTSSKTFKDSDDFLSQVDRGARKYGSKMTDEKRMVLKKALDDNPSILRLDDRDAMEKAMKKAVGTTARKMGLKGFGVKNYISHASKNARLKPFESNDALAAALETKGLKPLRNKSQKNDPDVYLVDDHHSEAYELGGINIVYKVEPDGTVKAQTSDINDLFGVGAPAAKKLITVTPMVTKNLGFKEPKEPRTAHGLSDVYGDINEPYKPSAVDYMNAAANVGGATATTAGGMFSALDEDVQP